MTLDCGPEALLGYLQADGKVDASYERNAADDGYEYHFALVAEPRCGGRLHISDAVFGVHVAGMSTPEYLARGAERIVRAMEEDKQALLAAAQEQGTA
jgi:hypothetical protein